MKQRLALATMWLLVLAALAGCSSMRTVSVESMRPAEVTFPSGVETLLIVDRTIYKGRAVNLIEGVLTGELPGEDRSGVQALIDSFQDEIMVSPRFQTLVAEEMLGGNSLTSAFPDPLPWKMISDLTSRYSADAVVAIEIYDTDFNITNGQREAGNSSADAEDGEEQSPTYYAEGVGSIAIGLRVYDPATRSIIDQQLYTRSNSWQATGVTVQDALQKLITKGEATREMSRRVAYEFARKIAPMPIQIKRSFYGESDKAPALEQGSRYADVGNWQGAIDAWQFGIDNAPREEAGQLAYNIAIAHEVLGDFEKAREWAEKAYVQYGNDRARDYVTALNRRLHTEELVRRQME